MSRPPVRFAVDSSDPAHPAIHTVAYIGGDPDPLTFAAAQQAVIRTMQSRKAYAVAEIDRLKGVTQRAAFPGRSGRVFGIDRHDPSTPQITTVDQLWGWEEGRDGLSFVEAKREAIAHHRVMIEHANDVCRDVRALTARKVAESDAAELEHLDGLVADVRAYAQGLAQS